MRLTAGLTEVAV